MSKRLLLSTVTLCAMAVAPLASAQEPTTLRVVMSSPVSNLDPIQTTATITLQHAMMVYDTLFAWDNDLNAQPQMVEEYEISDDRLTYTFTLRDGLLFHDGEPVTAEDVVASLERWGQRDRIGQRLMEHVTELVAEDEATVRLVLDEPVGYVLDALAKTGSNFPAIMPRRIAETSADEPITDPTGSGPFVFAQDEWVPGSMTVYEKFEDYVPRQEPVEATSGGKVVNFDRIEWIVIPDPQTAQSALISGEIDYLEQPQVDFLPILEASDNVTVETTNPFGIQGIIRMNHLQPPFDDERVRRALLLLTDQETYMNALFGASSYRQTCWAMFVCGSPLENTAGTEFVERDDRIDEARRLLEESGYDGEPVVILNPTDNNEMSNAALVTAQLMREAGMTVDVQSMDWSTLLSRRSNRGTPEEGGWSIFISNQSGVTALNPLTNLGIAANCEDAWFGWPCDERIEELRADYASAATLEERQAIAEELQARAYETVPYIPFGQWVTPIAYRSDRLAGVLQMPNGQVFWNIEPR